ncbi:MAG: SIMPL domain-containing protein [Planctomycetaceae bacterium]
MNRKTAQEVITISGTAEIRVVPDQIRIILAVISEAGSATESSRVAAAKVAILSQQWSAHKVKKENIVDEFVSVQPHFESVVKIEDGRKLVEQNLAGYRTQYNLRALVDTKELAMKALDVAFQNDVTDVLTFDYWSSDLDNQLVLVRRQALAKANAKADLLFSVFKTRPPILNISEHSETYYPHQLQATNDVVRGNTVPNQQPVELMRPQVTFFDGLNSQADFRPKTPVMQPEITVVSTVQLYFQSPAKAANQ